MTLSVCARQRLGMGMTIQCGEAARMVTVSGAVYANDAGTRSGSGKMDMNVDMDSWTWTWTWTWNARKNDNVDAAMGASRIDVIALARR